MRRARNLAAGLLDSGFAALGTFLAGLYAVRELQVGLLAAYAVLGAAAIFVMPLARQLVYLPSQVAANVLDYVAMPVLRVEVRRALPHHAVGAVVIAVVGATLLRGGDAAGVAALIVTAAAMAVVSPVQDHVRSCLHLVGWHLRAASCSVVVAASVGIAMLSSAAMPANWVSLLPFGALAVANAVSIAWGTFLLQRASRVRHAERPPFRDNLRFLLSEISVQGAWLGCVYVMLLLAGATAVAALEAARVAASPVFILSSAVSTFVAPALLRRLNRDAPDRAGAVREVLVALALLFVGALVWSGFLALFGPLVGVVLDRAFDLSLTALRSLAFAVEGAGALISIALLALSQARTALSWSIVAATVGLAGTLGLAAVIGAPALPIAQGTGMLVRLYGCASSGLRALDARVHASGRSRRLAAD